MYRHIELGNTPFGRLRKLQALISTGHIRLAGYAKGKIFGRLNCKAGKRMKPQHRLFFINKEEAIAHGYRPCGSCMRGAYLEWKNRHTPTSN